LTLAKIMNIADLKNAPGAVWSGLLALAGVATTQVIAHYSDRAGVIPVRNDVAVQVIGAIGSIFLGLVVLAWTLWRKIEKKEIVAAARAQGRLICECTAIGEVMVADPSSTKAEAMKRYTCPRCGAGRFVMVA
jgi:hypothetical protein